LGKTSVAGSKASLRFGRSDARVDERATILTREMAALESGAALASGRRS